MTPFKVGDRVKQISILFGNQNPFCIITKIDVDVIWHKHEGTYYNADKMPFGNSITGFGNFILAQPILVQPKVYGIAKFIEQINKK